MICTKEIDDFDFIVVNEKLTKEDHADTSRRLAEYLALRDSLRAQGDSLEEVKERFKSRFSDKTQKRAQFPKPTVTSSGHRRNRRDSTVVTV